MNLNVAIFRKAIVMAIPSWVFAVVTKRGQNVQYEQKRVMYTALI